MHTRFWPVPALLPLALAALLTAGCGKAEEEAAAAAPAPAAEAVAEAPAEAPATDAASSVGYSDVQGTIQEADAALKAANLEKAADALIKMQLSGATRQNEQSAVDHYARMTELNRKVAEGLASGDPAARRAAELLQRMHPK
jgi:hypothetical protein